MRHRTFETERVGRELVVVRPMGTLDGEPGRSFGRDLIELVESDVRIVIVDLSDVTRLGATAFGALLAAFEWLRARRGSLALVARADIARLLERSGAATLFTVCDSVSGAIGELARAELGKAASRPA